MSHDKTKSNAPAFPVDGNGIHAPELGLTKREYFAAIAMQGLLSNPSECPLSGYANDAVKAADELIKALNEEQK